MATAQRIVEMMERSSWIRRMFETGAELKAKHGARNVYDFSLGNPNLEAPGEVHRIVAEELGREDPSLHAYMPNAGYPHVREAVADYVSREQGVAVSADHIVMTCGAGGAMNVALKSILNPGDTVLATTPCFMEYGFYADNHGGNLELVPGRPDFDLDVDRLEEKITRRTAAVIVNSPNNPSGRVYPASTITALSGMLMRKSREIGRAVYLLSDEPYRKIVYDGVQVPSVLAAYGNSIVVTSHSKDLSLPGERIGYLAVNPAAEDAENLMPAMILCNRILGYVNAPALWQRVAGRAQGLKVDTGVYQRKRDMLCGGLRKIGYDFREPEGTFYLFPKSPTEDELATVDALRSRLILTVPGRGFGCPGHFRISFCVADEVIERSMDGFAAAFEQVGGRTDR